MDNNSLCSKERKLPELSVVPHIWAKLKKLKIQEDVLLQSLKHFRNENISCTNGFNFSKYTKELDFSYTKIKNMFDDIKEKTYACEILKTLDIEELKNNILKLEEKIKSFKLHLQMESKSLKVTEEEITKQLNYDSQKVNEKNKIQKIQIEAMNGLVRSPVKIIMNSPLKCLEVQKFQDFLKKSPNRYGGWNEYNHNIFKKLWHKYFQTYNNEEPNKILHSDKFDTFAEECHKNIYGLEKTYIVSHSKWYIQYLYLKDRQQKSIDRWKNNRKALKMTKSLNKINSATEPSPTVQAPKINKSKSLYGFEREIIKTSFDDFFNNKDFMDTTRANNNLTHPRNLRKDTSSTYRKPTKQWIYRCNDPEEKGYCFGNIESTKKLRIPDWRKSLSKP